MYIEFLCDMRRACGKTLTHCRAALFSLEPNSLCWQHQVQQNRVKIKQIYKDSDADGAVLLLSQVKPMTETDSR